MGKGYKNGSNTTGNTVYGSGSVRCTPTKAKRICNLLGYAEGTDGDYRGIVPKYSADEQAKVVASDPHTASLHTVEIELKGVKRKTLRDFRDKLQKWGITNACIDLP